MLYSFHAMEALPADSTASPGGRRWFDSMSVALMPSRRRIVAVAAILVAMPILYSLAAGPLVYLRSTGRPLLSDRAFAVIYHPLIRAEARIPPLGRAMHSYVSLWERAAEQQVKHDGR